MQVNNTNKDKLILGERPAQGLDDTILTTGINTLLILHKQENDLC